MKSKFKIIGSFWFIGAVFLLLINDFFLKSHYHNWFTGKLSDFAGLFFLPLFLSVIFPNRIKYLIAGSALFFVYWKSPFSDGLINLLNSLPIINYSRVVDYTDLLALLVLPLSYFIYQKREFLVTVRMAPAIPLSIAAFALLATSQERNYEELNQSYVLNQAQSNVYTFIDANLLNFENDGVYIRFRDSTLVDTAFFNMTLSGGQLVKEANIYASMIYLDSTHTEFFFFDYEQSMNECGFFRPRCKEPYDDKDLVLEEIETRFLDIL